MRFFGKGLRDWPRSTRALAVRTGRVVRMRRSTLSLQVSISSNLKRAVSQHQKCPLSAALSMRAILSCPAHQPPLTRSMWLRIRLKPFQPMLSSRQARQSPTSPLDRMPPLPHAGRPVVVACISAPILCACMYRRQRALACGSAHPRVCRFDERLGACTCPRPVPEPRLEQTLHLYHGTLKWRATYASLPLAATGRSRGDYAVPARNRTCCVESGPLESVAVTVERFMHGHSCQSTKNGLRSHVRSLLRTSPCTAP